MIEGGPSQRHEAPLSAPAMARQPSSPFPGEWRALQSPQKKFVFAAVAVVLTLYTVGLSFAVRTLTTYKARQTYLHRLRMDPTLVEPGRTPPDAVPATGDFVTVKIGTYLDTITAFSIRESTWSAEFYVWFNWQGPSDLDPGGRLVLVDGSIRDKKLLDDYHAANGVNYQRYRIAARFDKIFNTGTMPLDWPVLNIYIEDGGRDVSRLRYAVDPQSNVSSRASIAGYDVLRPEYIVQPHTYRSCYGDPRRPKDQRTTFSQYVAGINLRTSGLGVYFRIFLCLYAALAFALAAFFISPDMSPRFSLPAGAYFGVVANSFIINSVLPPSNVFGMVDIVVMFGLGTIFLTVVLSLISRHIHRRNELVLSATLDRMMFFTVGLCCIVVNLAIPLSLYRS
jgi:hypothetical protein